MNLDKLLAPNCPHCKQPVLFAHSREAVMIQRNVTGIVESFGPYHGECGKIVAQRALETKS